MADQDVHHHHHLLICDKEIRDTLFYYDSVGLQTNRGHPQTTKEKSKWDTTKRLVAVRLNLLLNLSHLFVTRTRLGSKQVSRSAVSVAFAGIKRSVYRVPLRNFTLNLAHLGARYTCSVCQRSRHIPNRRHALLLPSSRSVIMAAKSTLYQSVWRPKAQILAPLRRVSIWHPFVKQEAMEIVTPEAWTWRYHWCRRLVNYDTLRRFSFDLLYSSPSSSGACTNHWGIIRGIPIADAPRWNATYVGKQWEGSILNAFPFSSSCFFPIDPFVNPLMFRPQAALVSSVRLVPRG